MNTFWFENTSDGIAEFVRVVEAARQLQQPWKADSSTIGIKVRVGREEQTGKPSVGRIVHFKNREGECLAALVIRVTNDGLNLTVFGGDSPSSLSGNYGYIGCLEGNEPNHWHWPER